MSAVTWQDHLTEAAKHLGRAVNLTDPSMLGPEGAHLEDVHEFLRDNCRRVDRLRQAISDGEV